MESFVEALKGIQGVVWGPITILLLLFTGLYYTIRLKGIQIFHLHKSFQYIFEKEKECNHRNSLKFIGIFE